MPFVAYAEEFPAIYNSEADREAQPMSAEEAARRMKVPPGFHVGTFASEPDVQNPIAMTWDARGRLWIAENYTYAERSQRFDLTLRDRVIILADNDGDGTSDRRTVFTDQVQMLTGLEVGRGGVWLMCPPQLLFIPDADHDDVPDGPAQVVLDGFEVAKDNYHNFANGLRWGPDGWLYGRCGGSCPGRVGSPGTPDEHRVALEGGIWRVHPVTSHFEVLTHGTTNPWGHDWNQWGECFFINTVNGHLWHLIPGAHLDRPFTLDPNPHVYELIQMHADHWHFDTKGSWTDSRHGAANSFGGGHAHCGVMIYQGDNWPSEYRNRLLTWNLHGRRANQELIERHGSGYVAHHGPDTLLAEDTFFRGMDLSYGPDGAVYAIDWSDTGECHENTGVHRTSGRVFRVAYGPNSDSPFASFDLRKQSDAELVQLMAHNNEWYVRQARLVLAERSDLADDAKQRLVEMLSGDDPLLAYRALVVLHGVDGLEASQLRGVLTHSNEHLRVAAIKLLSDGWPIDDVLGPPRVLEKQRSEIVQQVAASLPAFCELAAYDDSGLVRLALASTLLRLPVEHRATLAEPLMNRAEDAEDHNLPLLVWYALMPVVESAPDTAAHLALSCQWPKTQRFLARRLAERIDKAPTALNSLVSHAASKASPATRRNILMGFSDGLKGWSRAEQPASWSQLAEAVARDRDDDELAVIRELSVLFGDGRALDEVRKIVLDEQAEISVRRSALETLVAAGGKELVDICLPLLGDARLNVVAARGVASSNDTAVAEALVKNYRRFRSPNRPQVIELLASRPTFARVLLDAVAENKISATDLTAFDVRQIRSLNDAHLQTRLSEIWGEVRETPAAKQQRIQDLRAELSSHVPSTADVSQGRLLFNQSCAKCHRLFGQGEAIGPDLTGANRSNLDYLLENVVDPSAVVSKDFRMTIVLLKNGQVLNGLIVSKNEKTLTLQTQTDKRVIGLGDVDELRPTTLSPMPDGLLDNLSPRQIRSLFDYLKQPAQVPLPENAE
ncbi:MAG: c-type cytochrome [Pirellulaceae bacterium]